MIEKMGKPKITRQSGDSSLNLENLPWISDRESQVKVREYTVVHKDDPFEWYRPATVKMDEKNVWTLKRYLNDQDQLTQYTQNDMMVKLGHTPSPWPSFFSSNWWKDMPTENSTNKRLTLEHGDSVPTKKQLSPIQLERTEKEVLWPNQHLCHQYRKVICDTGESWDEEASPFVALMGSAD